MRWMNLELIIQSEVSQKENDKYHILSNISFKVCVSLLILCFDDLSIGESGVLKSSTIIVLLSVYPLMPVSVCLLYLDAPMLGA